MQATDFSFHYVMCVVFRRCVLSNRQRENNKQVLHENRLVVGRERKNLLYKKKREEEFTRNGQKDDFSVQDGVCVVKKKDIQEKEKKRVFFIVRVKTRSSPGRGENHHLLQSDVAHC